MPDESEKWLSADEAREQIIEKRRLAYLQKQRTAMNLIRKSIEDKTGKTGFRDTDLTLKDWLEGLGYHVYIWKPWFRRRSQVWCFCVSVPGLTETTSR